MALVPEFLSGDLTSPKVRVSFQDGVCKKKKKKGIHTVQLLRAAHNEYANCQRVE